MQSENKIIQTSQLPYCLIFVPLGLTYIGNVTGWFFSLLAALCFVAIFVLDFFWKSKSKQEQKDDRSFSNQILYGVAIMQFLITLTFVFGSASLKITDWVFWISAFNTALSVSIAAVAGGHELIHRRSDLEKNIGTLQMALLFYGHHIIEHIQNHHRYVATAKDHSSTPINQSFYKYFWSSYVAEFQTAWNSEKFRLEKKQINIFTTQNHIIFWGLVNLGFLFFVALINLKAFFAYIFISVFFVVFHSAVVYSQHYGLSRSEDDKVNDTHSWQTDSMITEYILLGFGNHSDHHTRVTKIYTEIIQKNDGPNLPFGYFVCFLTALFPAKWFQLINPNLQK